MSKLYLSAKTDTLKNVRTARAHQWININLHFDEDDFGRVVNVRMNIPSDTNKPTLWIEGMKACEVEKDKGEMHCYPLKKRVRV